jgi:hypothetical protein
VPAPTPVAPSGPDSAKTPGVERPAEPAASTLKGKPLKKEYALLTVTSEPWGTLYVGAKEIGPTPVADYPLAVGTHHIRIEQEGYSTRFETIVVSGPNPIRRRYNLEPAGPP